MDFLNIKIKDKNYLYKKGTTIEEISKQFNINYKYPILISYVDNRLVELNKTLEKDCVLSFVDCTSRIGSRIYSKTIYNTGIVICWWSGFSFLLLFL